MKKLDRLLKLWENFPYYIYTHIHPETKKIFYIGKGKGGRAWEFLSRSPAHITKLAQITLEGYPINSWVSLQTINLTEEEALVFERNWIKAEKQINPDLLNIL